MATNYTKVSYGSQGNDVKTLQEMLNSYGYSLDVDGKFGPKTLAAVKDYQKKNKLVVDGIVGNNTWGSLYSSYSGSATGSSASGGSTSEAGAATTGTAASTSPAPTQSAADMEFTYQDYQESEVVQNAFATLQQMQANQPGAYESQWQAQINALMDKIMNREDFSYDLNGDALYQQYKDQYTQQGKMAMMDTMGQAQAMTGGYGNSYAQAVGQQAYQGYLQKLNEVVPELYQMAYNRYNQEGQDMLNQYSLLSDQEQQDYGRYRDEVSDYYTKLQQAFDHYTTERNFDYSQYVNGRDFAYGVFEDYRDYAYRTERDGVADQQTNYTNLAALIASTGYEPSAEELVAAGMSHEQAAALKGAYDTEKSTADQRYKYNELVKLISTTGYEPTAEELEAAGMNPEAARALANAYSNASTSADGSGGSGGGDTGSSGGGDTGASGYELKHVATMSSQELVTALQNYNAAEDDTGLALFLDDAVATGRITEQQADEYYEMYKTKKKDEEKVDTTVLPPSNNNSTSSNNNTSNNNGPSGSGGSGGRYGPNYVRE